MPRGQERCHYLGHSMTASLVLWWMTSVSASADALGKIRRVGRRLGVGVDVAALLKFRKGQTGTEPIDLVRIDWGVPTQENFPVIPRVITRCPAP